MEPEIQRPIDSPLSPVEAANALRAARMNALDLLDTAEILYRLKRFAHSMVFSTLSIEEAGKYSIVCIIVLGNPADRAKLWKSYRSHQAKTSYLGSAIEGRIRATVPEIPRDDAKKIGEGGPTPKQLELNKQLAVYSDCRVVSGKIETHLPQLVEWRNLAWERLCEAQALAHAMRDRTPEEFRVWLKHMQSQQPGTTKVELLRSVQKELLEKGLIKAGWWDTLLKDAEDWDRPVMGAEDEKEAFQEPSPPQTD